MSISPSLIFLYFVVNFSFHRVTLGRKACLALLVPLVMDHKELK